MSVLFASQARLADASEFTYRVTTVDLRKTKLTGRVYQVRSERKLLVCQRRTVNALLQNAVHHWAVNACQRDPRCQQKYQALRQRGKSYGSPTTSPVIMPHW